MRNMRLFKNNSIAKAFLICLLILSLIGCMAGCNQKTDADAPVRQSEGWAEKSFRNKMADASVTEVVIDDALVLASPVEVAGNKVISGEGSITAIAKNKEGNYMFVVPSGSALTVKGNVVIDAAGVMGGIHVQKDATLTLEENAAVKHASAKAANAMVEGKLLVNGGSFADANGHNIYNKNETVISGGTVTGSGEKFAGVYNEGKLTQDDGSICAAYYNVVSVEGSSYTFNKGSVTKSVNNAIVIEKGASLKITSKDASITDAGHRGIYLSGEAVIDQVTMKNGSDTLIKITETGKLTFHDGMLSNAGYHGIDNAGTLLVKGGTINNSYSCGIVNTGSLEMTGGTVMNNANKGILNKLNGVAKVLTEDVYLAGNRFAIGNEDNAYFELTQAAFSGSTNANIYAYGGEMYIHDITLAKSASNNVRVVAAKVTMEDVEILGNAASGSSTTHGILLEGGEVTAKNVTVIGTTGNGIRNKGGKFVGNNIALSSIGNHGVTNTNQDFTGREGVVIIDGLTVDTVRYNNVLAENGTITISNAVLKESGTNNIKVSGGILNLNNVDIQGNIAEAAENVHGIYTTGGTINGKKVTVTNTRGAALRVAGEEAVVSMNGFTAETLGNASVSITEGTVSITDGVMDKTKSNNIRIDGGALTLKNVTINGHHEGAPSNVHALYATGGKVTAEDLTVTASNGAGVRNNGGDVKITGLKVDNVGTHTLYLSNDKSITTITDAALGAAPSNNVNIQGGELTLTDSEILGHHKDGARDIHGILTSGGKVNLEDVTISGTTGSGIRNKGAVLNGKNVTIDTFGGYNALSNAASDSGLCGELNIDGLTVTNSVTDKNDLVILASQCDGKVNISNAKFATNTETVTTQANVLVDAGTVVLDNIEMEVVTSNSFRVNGGNVTLKNATIPGHVEGSANNVNAFYTIGGTTLLENITITNPTGDGLRVNVTADEGGKVIAEPTVTANNVTVTGAGRHSMWVSGGEITVDGATFSGLKSDINNVLVNGGKATLINVVSDKVNKNNNICVNSGELNLQNVQILGHNEGAATSNHGLYANGGKLIVDGVSIENTAGSGIRVDNNAVVDAKDVKISVTGQHGIRLGDAGEEASNNLKVTINGLTIENTKTNNILHENGELTVKNAVLHESTSNNIKLIGGKLNLENVQVLGHRDGVRSDNHGIFIEITKNSTATLNAKDILVSNTAGAALRNKGGNVTVNGLVISNIGANTLISNVDHQSVPGVMSISRLGVSEGCDHAQYVVHNQTADTKNPGKFTNELTVKDSIMLLDSKSVGVFAEYGKVTVENSVISGAMYAIHNKAELTVNGGSLHNNGWSVRNEEGAKATLNGGFYYGNKEGTLPSDIYNGGELTIENITVGYNKKGAGRPGVIYQAATADPIIMKGNKMGLHTAAKKLQLAAEEWVRKWGTEKNLIIKCDSVADALEAERFFDPGIEDPKMFVSAVGSNLELTTQPGGNFIIQIGEERFGSFADALKYIAENDSFNTTEGGFKKAATIQIIDSYLHFENVVIPKGYNLTLVDDGKNVHVVAYDSNLTGDMFTVGEGAQLNLKVTGNTNPDSGLIFSGSTDSAKKAAVFCVDGGNIKLLNDLSIEKAYYGIRLVDGEFNAAGKTINTAGTYGIHAIGGELKDAILSGSGTAVCVNDENADATLTNITINGYGTGIYGNAGKLTTNGLTSDAATYNVNVNGTADITVSDATFGKTTSNNAVVNGGKLTLTDVTINGHVDGASGTIHSVMAQGGETTLNNVTITHAKNSGIRIKNNGTIVNMNGGSIANVGNDAINVTDDVVLNSTGNLTISHAAANGVNAAGSAQITIENLTISDVKTRNIIVTGTASVTVESGSFGTTQDAMNIEAKDNSTLNLSNATVTHTSAVEWPHGNTDKINTPVHVMGNSKVTLDNVTLNGGKYGIRVHTSQNVTLNNVTIKDSTQFGMWLQASPKVTVTGELKISGTGSNGIQVNSGTLDASNATKVEITDAGANGLDIRGTANVKNLTVTGAAECGITTIGTVNLTGATTMSNITADGICTNGTNAKVKATGNLTIQNVKRAVFAEKGEIEIAGTKDTITGKYSVSFSNNFKNLVTDGSGKIIAINVKLDKTAETNVEANGKDASIKLENAEVCGTEAYNAVAAQGGDISLNNVTISSSKTAGIRVNNADSSVTVKNVTVSTAGTIGVSMNKGSLTVEDNGEADKASLVITNATTRGIEITGSGVQEIQDDVNISHDEKKSWAMVATTGGKITAADGTKITITGTEYGLVSHNNSIISLDEVAISGVKTNNIYVDGQSDATEGRTGVTIKRGTLDTTAGAYNVNVFGGGKLSLSNAAVTSTTTKTDNKVKDHKGTKVNAVICVRESGTVVDLNGVEVTGGTKGIYISDSAVVNSSGSLKITDSREFALYAYAGGKFIGTDASSLATVINENASDRTDYSIYANGSGTEVTVYNATLGKTQSNNVGSYDGAVVTINGTADKYSVINGNVKSNSTTHGVIVTAGTVNLNYVNIIGANIAGVRTNNNNSVLNCNYVTVSGHSDHGFSLGSGQSAATTLKNITVTGTAGDKYDIYYGGGKLNISEKINAHIYSDNYKTTNVVDGLAEGSNVVLSWANSKLPTDYVAVNFVKADGTSADANGMDASKAYISESVDNYSLTYVTTTDKTYAMLAPELVMSESDLKAVLSIAEYETASAGAAANPTATLGKDISVGQIDLPTGIGNVTITSDSNATENYTITFGGTSANTSIFKLESGDNLALKNLVIDGNNVGNIDVVDGSTLNVENVTIQKGYQRAIEIFGTSVDNRGQVIVTGNLAVNDTKTSNGYAITINGYGKLDASADGAEISMSNANYGLVTYANADVDINNFVTSDNISIQHLYIEGSGTVVEIQSATIGKSTTNNVRVAKGATLKLSNATIAGHVDSTTTENIHGVYIDNGKVYFNNVEISGSHFAGIRAKDSNSIIDLNNVNIHDTGIHGISFDTGSVTLRGNSTINGCGTTTYKDGTVVQGHGIWQAGGTLNVTDTTISDVDGTGIYVVGGNSNISGKVVADIYYNAAKTLNVTSALTEGSALTVDWDSGKAPTGTAISFASEDVMSASMSMIKLGTTQSDAGNLLYFHMDGENAVATLVNKVVTSEAELTGYLAASAQHGTSADVLIGASFPVTNQVVLPAGLTSVTISDKDATDTDTYSITASGVSPFAIGNGQTLTMKDLTVGGSGVDNAAKQIRVGTGAALDLQNVTVQYFANDFGAIFVYDTGKLTATGSTFANNKGTGSYGGAIANWGGTVEIENSTFNDNTAPNGVALFNYYCDNQNSAGNTGRKGSVKLTGCTFLSNTATGNGGALAMYGDGNSMVITNCTFGKLDSTTGAISEGNTASSGGAVFIQNNCSLTIDDSRFYGNTAQYGGAMAAYQSVTVTDSVFLANTAANSGGSAGAGGAVYFKTQGTSVFTNCSFGDPADRTKGNSSVWGGALLVEDSGVTVTLKNCGFYDSTATGHTGAILIKDAAVVNVEGCTFENNNGNGGGAINLENNKANVLTLKDVVFTGTGDARKVAAGYSAADISISGKVVADIYYTNADVLNVTGALASGSDVTVDWAVGKEPATAISFADAATLTASKDYISLGATQKGAGKYLSYSDTTATLAAGKTVATDANLKEAVEGASNGDILILLGDSYSVTESMKIGGKELTLLSAGDNTTLTVASGVSPFTLTSGDVLTLENLTVGGADGALAAQIVVPANATLNLKDSTLQYMKGAVKVNTSGVLNAVGCVFANNSGAEYGSAVGNWGGTSYVADCVFDNNSASKSGGAILNYQGGALTVENSSFTNNYAANRGGAIAAWNTDSGPLSTTTIKNCVFGNPDDTAGMTDNNGNTAGSAGGAIDFNNKNITYTVEDSKFYFNSASYGGAICSGGDTAAEVSIKNSIFKGNSATVNGGAILHEGATTLTLDGCNFEGNSADSSGGAICHASDTASIIKNCVFGNAEDTTMCNEASYSGGAIDISKGSPTIQNCKFYYNSATYIGGAVRFGIKVATVDGCTFVGNKTTASVNNGTNKGSDVGGGAIMAQGTPTNLTIQNSTFESNTSAFGGGALKTNSGTINVKGCTFGNAEDNTQGNTAPKGGAIYHQGNTLYILDLDGTKSYFYTNKATDGDGGAIYAGNVMTVTNAVFTGNMATGNGGAISAVNTVTIDGSEFAKNECNGEGAGINLPTGKTLNISNCVFTGNVTHKAAGNSNYGYGDIRVADSSDGNGVFVSGKFVGKIWMNQEDYINITGALTSDSNLVIDWRVGQIRESTTGVAIKFASQEIMEQSQAQIHIGEDASTTENYAFHYATSAPWQAIFVTKP